MSYQIPYHRTTFRPVNDLLPGNQDTDNPVEFDLAPAAGADLARIKSVVYATLGLVQGDAWTPDVQEAVIRAFDTGAPAFVNTVEAIRGLTIPAALALRVGIIQELPKHVPPGKSSLEPNPEAPVPVVSGLGFSKICGFVPAMALHVAMQIAEISQKTEAVDPRFFGLPSGSGGPGTQDQKASTAGNARRRSKGKGTAAGQAPTGSQPAGTSAPGQ